MTPLLLWGGGTLWWYQVTPGSSLVHSENPPESSKSIWGQGIFLEEPSGKFRKVLRTLVQKLQILTLLACRCALSSLQVSVVALSNLVAKIQNSLDLTQTSSIS